MSELKLQVGKLYRCRNGQKCRIAHQNKNGKFISVSVDEKGDWLGDFIYHSECGMDPVYQLDIVAEWVDPPKPFEAWVNIYCGRNGDYACGRYHDEKTALEFRQPKCVRTVLVREVIE